MSKKMSKTDRDLAAKRRKVSKPSLKLVEKAEALNKLSPKQEEFVEYYLTSDSVLMAARNVSISDRTARRWLAIPAIQAAINQLRQERRQFHEDRLVQCMDYAIDIVNETLFYASQR